MPNAQKITEALADIGYSGDPISVVPYTSSRDDLEFMLKCLESGADVAIYAAYDRNDEIVFWQALACENQMAPYPEVEDITGGRRDQLALDMAYCAGFEEDIHIAHGISKQDIHDLLRRGSEEAKVLVREMLHR